MAYFRKRDNGWEYRISYKDVTGKYRQKSKSGFKTKKQAELEANKIEIKLSKGVQIDNNIEFYTYFKNWSELYKLPNVTATTWDKYKYTLSKVGGYFEKAKLSSIKPSHYQRFISEYLKKYNWQTVKMINTHIKQSVKMAIHEGYITRDFTAFAVLPKPDDSNIDDKFLELSEYRRLILETSKEVKYKSHFCIYFIATTGLRFSEAMGLTWNDIDENDMLLHVNKTYKVFGSDKGFQPTKNKHSVRYVPINTKTIELLHQYKLLFKTETRIFEGISNTAVNKTLKKLVGRNVHIHSLRHTYVSYLISKGVDLFAVSKIVGHKDLNITLSTYAHLLEDTKSKNNNIVRKLFGADLGLQ
ncbi:tyrosine-type recombinase/integrase [Streptococcus agalactiae]|uniref:site-specific integrase n=1 Tax=Streptococcus agalactiae TaxID=1311 RepID=UPI0002D85313|nr:tyrosine-type recombinase/integrase [Streptococcus agalactiae]EPW92146.1 integrase [Streptococcus agalactiae MRI Z1-023]KAF1105924.1 site-specific integrase [Streptococcus agalactiae]KAF1136739.1 site-specific integrase [Streptococcus agalactiae]KAF1145006.1 site-specific integrase [Streptococcus agalactiae]KAF1166359.1 site-specific integrase [Streptococcus agalactiae]